MKLSRSIIFLSCLAVVSCGNGKGGNKNSLAAPETNVNPAPSVTPEANELPEGGLAASGTYYTVLRPVNFQSNGFIPYGAATFTLNNDQLQVSTSLDDDQAVVHRQTLHAGNRCPTLADDTNHDGFIDYDESQAVVGSPLMPLDADLNSQASGAEAYPKGPGMTYSKVASHSKIVSDLGLNLSFEGRVILVHGTSYQSSFPLSLSTYPGEQSNISLPVVCGVLEKI